MPLKVILAVPAAVQGSLDRSTDCRVLHARAVGRDAVA
jgi:hypothetical protein